MRVKAMLLRVKAAVVLFLVGLAGCPSAPTPTPTSMPNGDAGADAAPAGPKPRFVVVTHTAGFRHDSIPVAEQTLAELGAKNGDYEVAYARNADDVKSLLTPAGLDGYAGVVFANTTGDLGIPDLAAFLDWIAQGHAFIGAHSATDTYRDKPDFVAMLGAAFKQHGSPCEVEPKVEDTGHPAAAGLGSTFKITDEIYEWAENPRPRVQVLFALDKHPPDGHPEANQPGDFPLSWTKSHGKGRVFYTALGHGNETWKDERFRQHILGALRWSVSAR